jgi:amidohydrolase
MRYLVAALSASLVPAAALAAPPTPLIDIYRSIHAHPELSHHEERTSALLATELRAAGYEVTDHVGVYADSSRAFGVVGILRNGKGPTLLIRGDMDALPIVEKTGLPYASHVMVTNDAGQSVGVMHACGHDIHTTNLIGVARALAAARGRWHGTLMLVGQPSEETVDGAAAMLADGLYQRFGTPDMIIGLHDSNGLPAGKVGVAASAVQAGADSVDILVRGVGAHGAEPQNGKDPVVIAALLIAQLQTIASREENALDPAVITVGSIHGGTKRNIIPEEVKLQLTVRAFSEKARGIALDGIRRMAAGVALSAGLPPEKAPVVTVLANESAPPLINDKPLAARAQAILAAAIGADNVVVEEPIMPSEDVGRFALDHRIPIVYYTLGAMNPARFAAASAKGESLPGPHNDHFQPDPEPTLDTGVRSMTALALALLK